MRDEVSQALEETSRKVEALEAEDLARREAVQRARTQLDIIRRHRRSGRVPMWEAAQRAAARTGLLAVGCVLVIAGAMSLDGSLGAGAVVLAFAVLALEGAR